MPFRRFWPKPTHAAVRPPAKPPPPPPPLAIEAVTPFLRTHLGLPHLDWGRARDHIQATTGDASDANDLAAAMSAGWLDALARAMRAKYPAPLERWRDPAVEGLGPASDRARLERSTARALATIGRALAPIRGEPDEHPIAHITIIAAPTMDAYYDFVDAYHHDEGDFGTWGGMYFGASPANPSMLVLNAGRDALEHTIAHELTHHALAPTTESAGRLPLWAEEGLTQMMEERVTNQSFFAIDHEKMRRHRALWSSMGLAPFLSGESFGSPNDDHQELAYNLAEAITRSLLDTRPADFFAFARACLAGQDAPAACEAHLGVSQERLLADFLGT